MNAATSIEMPDAAEAGQEIYEAVTEAINNRKQYDERLRVCWDVRHNGIKRKRDKAWQSDTPCKIADPAIDKIKPQLVQGIYTADTVATFTAKTSGVSPQYAKLASQHFSYRLKHESNFFKQFVIVTDMQLQDGKAMMKVIYNTDKKRVEYHAVASIYCIVPVGTEELEETDWFCQIHRLTNSTYKRWAKARDWPRDKEFIEELAGRGPGAVLPKWADDKKRLEGLHYGSSDNEIVIWEYYERDENNQWSVTFLSPSKPDEPLQDKSPFPYKHGKLPFIEFNSELKDKDYHSPRGVVEKILPEERIATSYRNTIGDHVAFSGRPMFTTNGTPIGNINNLTAEPGKVFPGINLQSVQMAPPPEILQQEMNNARAQAEQLGGAGDYLLGQSVNTSTRRTATEVGEVARLASSNMDLRTRLTRDSLTEVFRQGWSLECQYRRDELTFFFEQSMHEMPEAALVDKYLIQPSGNADGYSRAYEIALAQSVYQQCKGDPAFDQDELRKYILETVDASLVKRLFIGTQAAQKREAQDQAYDILLLKEGFPTVINPGEDQAARAILTSQFLQRVVLTHEPISPQGMQALQQHIVERLQFLAQSNQGGAAQLKQQLKQIEMQTVQAVQAQAKQQQAAAAGAQGMPQAPQPQPMGAA